MTNTPVLNPPSIDPADLNSLSGTISFALSKFLQYVDDMLPAQIVAYDRATNMAQVQPMISIVTTGDTILQRAPVMSVPVLQIGGGGFVLNFPIKAGDLGWLKANDRDISLFKQSWNMSQPNTSRKHDFGDAIFIPSILTGFAIAGSDTTKVTLQSLNGSIRLSMGTTICVTDQPSYTPSTGAVLDVQSTTKAFKVPRMTHAQRDAIPSPEGGFVVYVTDTPTGFSFYTDGLGWS